MNIKNRLMTLAAASVLMTAATAASATTYTMFGSGGTTSAAFGGAVVADEVVTGFADVDDIGGVFNSGTFVTTVTITSAFNPDLLQIQQGTFVFTDAAGNGIMTIDSCSENAGGTACAAAPIGVVQTLVPEELTFFDASDLNNIIWTMVTVGNSPAAGGEIITTINYSASPAASAVPVPAAAWLFGSAILGLVGIGRKRAA